MFVFSIKRKSVLTEIKNGPTQKVHVCVIPPQLKRQCGTLMTVPIMGSVRIRPGWGVGQRSMSLQAVDKSHIQQSATVRRVW